VCAAPDYLREHGTPTQAEQLALHNCLTHSYYGSVWLLERDGMPVNIAVKGNISANDATSLVQAALAGAGITMLPTYLAAPFIQSGRLIALLPEYHPQEFGIFGVYASRKHMPATLRTMLDFLAERFTDEPAWDKSI
jgi:DNA-binding transcriptional LysR family regulator